MADDNVYLNYAPETRTGMPWQTPAIAENPLSKKWLDWGYKPVPPSSITAGQTAEETTSRVVPYTGAQTGELSRMGLPGTFPVTPLRPPSEAISEQSQMPLPVSQPMTPSYAMNPPTMAGYGQQPTPSFGDWFKNLGEDKSSALSRGLMQAGLTMMAQGPSPYPITLGQSLGTGGLAGLAGYDEEMKRQAERKRLALTQGMEMGRYGMERGLYPEQLAEIKARTAEVQAKTALQAPITKEEAINLERVTGIDRNVLENVSHEKAQELMIKKRNQTAQQGIDEYVSANYQGKSYYQLTPDKQKEALAGFNKSQVAMAGAKGAMKDSATEKRVNKLAEGLLSGKTAPSQMTWRDKGAALAAAFELDPTYDAIEADTNFAWYKNPKTQQALRRMDTLLENSGSLDESLRVAKAVDNPSGTPINKLTGKAKIAFGDSKRLLLDTAATLTADEVGQLLGSAQGSDFTIKLGQTLNNPDLSVQQFSDNIEELRYMIYARMKAYSKGTPYQEKLEKYEEKYPSLKRYSTQGTPAIPPPAVGGMPGGRGKVLDKATAQQFYLQSGKDPKKATELARQAGYEVQ